MDSRIGYFVCILNTHCFTLEAGKVHEERRYVLLVQILK